MNASLNEKLGTVKWGEFKLGDLFEVVSYKKCFDANKVAIIENRGHPYIVRQSTENGRKGNIDEPIKYLNPGNTISFGQDTATMFYQEKPYFTGDKIKILRPKYAKFGKNNAQFFLSTMRKAFCSFAWGSSRFNVETLKKQMVSLPIKNNGYIDFDFMESFIAELEAERVAELSAYLTVSGLDNYELSSDEENALKNYQSLKWDTYNLEKLFGKSTRGKRLKGDDRIAGTLPFVTAGEASEGISAYISNEVEVFEKNTTTIDMFGSAKYRNYIYGGDDHIAVVHTENLPKYASIFVTTAIHKSSHNGQFDYGHNFYAKDADALYISLPVNEAGNPDYDKMAIIISAIHMRKGWDLMSTLILCNLSGIVLNLVLGTIAPAKMFANDGPIVAGMSGMMTLVLYVTLLFQLLEILNSSGAFDGLTVSLMKHCKSPRSGELICYLVAALGSVVTGGSGIAIVFFGSLVRRITKAFHIDRCRGANILDGVACGATGLMPHGNPTLVSLGVALAIDGVDPNFSFLDIIPYNFHCWGLMLIFLLSILTGIGRRFEKPEETANA